MIDKVQKIREEIEKLKSQLLRGACSSQIAMETSCKEEAYNEVLSILDSLQGEPSKFDAAIQEGDDVRYNEDLGCRVNLSQLKRVAKKEEPVSKNYRERYKRIAQSEKFKKTYEGMSVGEIMHVEGEEPVSEDFEKIVEEIAEPTILNAYGTKELARRLRNTICGTSVSEDLNEAVTRIIKETSKIPNLSEYEALYHCAVEGAKWQKENLWKSADGDELPEIGREVIALLDNGKVVFAHRPPEYWDGKNIITGKVTRNYPKTYDKGGWNIPNIVYWLDVELPKEIES